MRYLSKEQARTPKREAEPITLPEYSAPLLLAKPSADLAVRFREGKIDLRSAEAITAMVADMVVDESGAPMVLLEDVPAFLKGISSDSLTAIMTKCAEMFSGRGGASVPQKPSTNA